MPDNYNIPSNQNPKSNESDFNIPKDTTPLVNQELGINYNINGGITSPFNSSLQNQIPLNIPNVLQSIVGPLIRIPHPTLTQIGLDLLPIYHIQPIPDSKKANKPIGFSKLGTPIMDKITFTALETDVPRGQFKPDDSAGDLNFYFLTDVLITVSQSKKIVYTDIAGNNQGTVKEYIGLSDFDVSISGRLTGNYGQRPRTELLNLKAILDVGKTVSISSKYLIDLNITDLVVTTYDLPQIIGEYSTQYFTINLVSDNKPDEAFISFL
jgi:hypothetical protein